MIWMQLQTVTMMGVAIFGVIGCYVRITNDLSAHKAKLDAIDRNILRLDDTLTSVNETLDTLMMQRTIWTKTLA